MRTGLLVLSLLAHASGGAGQAPTRVERARAHFEAGQAYYRAGRFEDARRALLQAFSLLPSAELAYNLGRVSERLGRAEEAIAHYEDYLRRLPAEPRSASERARVQKRLAALHAEVAARAQMLKAPPPTSSELVQEARRFFLRGVRLFERKQYAGALAAFGAAQRLSRVPELYFNLGLTCERLGNTRDAADYYRAYLDARPGASDHEAVAARVAQLSAP